MKYPLAILVAILVLGGIAFGFIIGNNMQAPTGTDTQQTSNTPRSSVNARVLDLRDRSLTKVSADVYDQTATTDLILSNNQLKSLPSEMGRMTQLVVLKVDHNVIEGSLIGEIRKFSQLKHLDASYNKMTGVPAEIGQLRNLEVLDYSYNNISGLPNELAQLKDNLKVLNLTGNPLSQDKIARLKADLPSTNVIF